MIPVDLRANTGNGGLRRGLVSMMEKDPVLIYLQLAFKTYEGTAEAQCVSLIDG